jgi:hypothetical protein
MNPFLRALNPRAVVACLLAYAYFVMFPEDLAVLTQPLQPLADAIRVLFEITSAISPWLYGIAGIGAACWTARRVTTQVLESRERMAAAARTTAPPPQQ